MTSSPPLLFVPIAKDEKIDFRQLVKTHFTNELHKYFPPSTSSDPLTFYKHQMFRVQDGDRQYIAFACVLNVYDNRITDNLNETMCFYAFPMPAVIAKLGNTSTDLWIFEVVGPTTNHTWLDNPLSVGEQFQMIDILPVVFGCWKFSVEEDWLYIDVVGKQRTTYPRSSVPVWSKFILKVGKQLQQVLNL